MDRRGWIKAVISIWLLFHLVFVIFGPNELSYVNQVIYPVSLPYTNTLGMNRGGGLSLSPG